MQLHRQKKTKKREGKKKIAEIENPAAHRRGRLEVSALEQNSWDWDSIMPPWGPDWFSA